MIVLRINQSNILEQLVHTLEHSDYTYIQTKSLVELFQNIDTIPEMYIIEAASGDDSYLKAIELLRKSKSNFDFPIVIIMAAYDPTFVEQVLSLNVDDIFYFPISKPLMLKRIKNLLSFYHSKEAYLSLANISLKEIQDVQTVMIESLATLAEYRDPETGEHIKRTQNYVKALAQHLMKEGLFKKELTERNIELIYLSVPLHDIGKVGIPDDVLLKPGKLTPDEFELMKTHTIIGHEALLRTGSKIKDNAFLKYADDVAYTHQEKFDGSGYPRGLKGTEIPLIGRLMAVADVYDALISKRVYKEAYSHEKAVGIIKASNGSHFDPILVNAFLEIQHTFKNIALTYQDTKSHQHYPDQLVKYAQDGTIKNILLVDDSRIIRTILKNQLQRIGFIIDEAEDGKQGLKKIKEKHYDLILSDVEMPEMNGFEFTQKAVKYLGPEALIIIMTATAYDASEEQLESVGAKGLLLKPVDLTRLEDKLTKYIDSQHSQTISLSLKSKS